MDGNRARNLVGLAIGILLVAGFGLGRVLGGVPGEGPVATCDEPLPWHAAAGVVGERAAIAGPVAATAHEPELGGEPTFINLGNAHPDDDRFDVVIYEDVRERFDEPPEEALEGTEVCVQGEIRERDGVPQIILDAPSLLRAR